MVKAGDDPFIIFPKEISTLYHSVGPVGDAITNMVVTLLYIPCLSRKSDGMVTTRPALG
jgi:hypothetical protein